MRALLLNVLNREILSTCITTSTSSITITDARNDRANSFVDANPLLRVFQFTKSVVIPIVKMRKIVKVMNQNTMTRLCAVFHQVFNGFSQLP